jgi:hypothetical protein
MNSSPYLIELSSFGNEASGFLSMLQNSICPFQIQRVYWIYDTPNDSHRGSHAFIHHQKILVAVAGEVEVETENVNGVCQKFMLSCPKKALFLPDYHWIKTYFSNNAILLALASAEYNEEHYIKDYQYFRSLKDETIS